jgi:hypothetical protein
LKFVPSGQ